MSPSRSAPLGTLAPVFAALGDRTRLGLVDRLSTDGPLSIARLAAGAPITRQAITKHLRALARAGVVRSARAGREQIWQLEPTPLMHARLCLDRVSDQWDAALGRLRALVENEA